VSVAAILAGTPGWGNPRQKITKFPPELFLQHTAEREFVGPAVLEMTTTGELWMVAPWGRPPVNFGQVKGLNLPPYVYRSKDGGRNWIRGKRMNMPIDLPGMISDGGITLLRLQSRKILAAFNRNVEGYKGGGVPGISISADEGQSWSPLRKVQDTEDIFYLMNERVIQLRSGRLVMPVALKPPTIERKTYGEGSVCQAACFLSDDEGKSWHLSKTTVIDDERGMAEPAVAELDGRRILMLARTGSGSHHASISENEGETWIQPRPTTLRAACSSLTLKRLPTGDLFVVFNPGVPLFLGSFFPRRPLSYAVSRDQGRSWSAPVVIDDVKGQQLIYPSVTPLKNGILIVYSAHLDPGDGQFSTPEDWKIGGAKRCLIDFPSQGSFSGKKAYGNCQD